ncbi:MAG: preprotein translocase subunit SecG [Ramlibacter sp.]
MNALLTIVLAVQMLTALAMIGLILVQHGKGADMGAAFGSGSSGSLFGASGSANFLSRTTGVLAAVFFACTLLLAYFGNARPAGSGSVLERAGIPAPAASAPAPAVPAGPAGQIPGGATSVPAPQGPATSPGTAPAVPASGAGAIPTK